MDSTPPPGGPLGKSAKAKKLPHVNTIKLGKVTESRPNPSRIHRAAVQKQGPESSPMDSPSGSEELKSQKDCQETGLANFCNFNDALEFLGRWGRFPKFLA